MAEPRKANSSRWLLLGTTLVVPWLNGGVDVLPQWILFVLGAGLATLWFRSLFVHAGRFKLSWTSLATLGGLFLCIFHLLPIWSTGEDALVPSSVALRRELSYGSSPDQTLLGKESTDAELRRQATLPEHVAQTLDPHATRQMLALLILVLVTLLASARWIESPGELKFWMTAWSWNGAALTLFAVLVKATWNGKLFWCIPVGFGKGVFGPIVYHNLAGNVLMMTTAAAWYGLAFPRPAPKAPANGIHVSLIRTGWQWPDGITIVQWLVLVANIVGLLLTLSRGSLVSLLFACLVALVWFRPRRGWGTIAIPAAFALCSVLGLLAWFRATEAVSQRYSSLMETEKLVEDVRLDHWQDGLRAAGRHGVLGVGMGAYRHVHLMFQDNEIERSFLRAHNQYLETWVDSGVPGLLLLAGALVSTGLVIGWLSRRSDSRLRLVAILGCVVVAGQVAHAGLDFCLYLPASAVMFATLVGAVVGIAWRAAAERSVSPHQLGVDIPVRWFKVIGFGLLIGSYWNVWIGARWAREEDLLYSVPWDTSNREVPVADIRLAIDQLTPYLPITDDWRVPLALGELALTDFRHRLSDELRKEMREELEKQGTESVGEDFFWPFTDPMVLHGRSHALAAEGKRAVIETEIRSQPLIREQLAHAHACFRAARRLSPMVGQVHLRLAELDFLRAKPDYNDTSDLDRLERIAVGNPDLLFEAGRRHATAGREARAIAAWRESLRLSPRHWPDIYGLVGVRLTPTQLLENLLPDDPKLLLTVAGKHFTEPEQRTTRERFLDAAERLLGKDAPAQPKRAAEWHLAKAELELLREQRPKAIDHTLLAVRLRPDDHALRAQLANLLALEGRLDEAQQEARYCLGLQPNNWDYRFLFERIMKRRQENKSSGKSDRVD